MTPRFHRSRRLLSLSLAALAVPVTFGPAPLPARAAVRAPRPEAALAASAKPETSALRFEPNLGQVAGEARFVADCGGASLALEAQGLTLILTRPREEARPTTETAPGTRKAEAAPEPLGVSVRLHLEGANPEPLLEGEQLLPGETHYFLGNDPSKWVRHVPAYGRVRAREVYPGVDVVYYSRGGQLEYDFVVAAGADPRAITLRVEGAESVGLGAEGALVMETAADELRQPAPVVYQESAEGRRAIAGRYVELGAGAIGFELGAYDASAPLVIDPVLVFRMGSGNRRRYKSVATDGQGNTYATGTERFYYGSPNVYVTRIDSSGLFGSAIVFGGSRSDGGADLALDGEGNVWVTGTTGSRDFPVTANAAQPSYAGGDAGGDAFVAKVSATVGEILYATYIGGSGGDLASSIALDADGNAYVTGETRSHDFPTRSPFQAARLGLADAFVAKVSGGDGKLLYSTYLGGSNSEAHENHPDIAVDATGSACVVGDTDSEDFPTVAPLQAQYGGSNDAFVAKLSPSGSSLAFSTYLGGTGYEAGWGVAVDVAGAVYVAGFTGSDDFPVVDALQPSRAGEYHDAFVAKLDPTGASLVYSTFLGGTRTDKALGIAVTAEGSAYVTGVSTSADFPIKRPLPGGGPPPSENYSEPAPGECFLANLNSSGSALRYSTFLDHTAFAFVGDDTEFGLSPVAVATDNHGFTYVSVPGEALKIEEREADLGVQMRDGPDPVGRLDGLTYTITVANEGPVAATSVVVTTAVPSAATLVSRSASQGLVFPLAAGDSGQVTWKMGTLAPGATATLTLKVKIKSTAPLGTLTNQASATSAVFDPDPTNNAAQATTTVQADSVL
jgi:uncharacterized repeat protein (TIGR01451 family)